RAKLILYAAFVEGDWRLHATFCPSSTSTTSSRSTRRSGRERCGASRTPSRLRSKNSGPSASSSLRRSSGRSWGASTASADRQNTGQEFLPFFLSLRNSESISDPSDPHQTNVEFTLFPRNGTVAITG